MTGMQKLPPMPRHPKSTSCEVRQWKTVPLAEARANGEQPVTVRNPTPDDPTAAVCDVWRWRVMTVEDALATNERDGRCIECKMPVRAHRAATNGMAAHFEHLKRNPRCSLSDDRY